MFLVFVAVTRFGRRSRVRQVVEDEVIGIENIQRVVDSQKLAEQEFDQEKLFWCEIIFPRFILFCKTTNQAQLKLRLC